MDTASDLLTLDEPLHQRAVGTLIRAVHNTVGDPREVAHVTMSSSALCPGREGKKKAEIPESRQPQNTWDTRGLSSAEDGCADNRRECA